MEVAEKVQDLKKFQENLNSRCTKIHQKIGYADLSGPSVSHGPTAVTAIPKNHKFTPVNDFLPSEWSQPRYTTASDFITDKDFFTILEWLRSGGHYATYTDPVRWVKLLLNPETARSFD